VAGAGPDGTSEVPAFACPSLHDGAIFTKDNLLAEKSQLHALLFVAPSGFSSDLHKIRYIFLRINNDVPGHVRLVCRDSTESCRRFIGDVFADPAAVSVLLDADGLVARAFRVTKRAEAVYVDSAGRIVRRGSEVRGARGAVTAAGPVLAESPSPVLGVES
jgi:hypothetical protein